MLFFDKLHGSLKSIAKIILVLILAKYISNQTEIPEFLFFREDLKSKIIYKIFLLFFYNTIITEKNYMLSIL